MKLINTLTILTIFMLMLTACGSEQAPQTNPTTDPTVQELTENDVPAEEPKMIDISTAMQLAQPMKCTSTYEGQTSTIYMKGNKMRIDTMPVDAHGIYTEDTMYTWQGNQGMMMKISEVKKMAESMGQQYQAETQEDVVKKAHNANAQCESYDAPESTFTPPTEVQFQDFGQMMTELENAAMNMQR